MKNIFASITGPLRMVIGLVLTVLMAIFIGLLLRQEGVRGQVETLLEWVGENGTLGVIVFIFVYMLLVIFLLPGILFTMAAGFLFGPVWGVIWVLMGTTVGASFAFLIARYLLHDRVRNWINKSSKLMRVEKRMSAGGWRAILLTRMVPFFPFKLSNYAFGVMPFKLRDLALGTVLGCIPITALNVYAGSLAKNLATVDNDGDLGGLRTWVMAGLGLLALIVVLFLAAGKAGAVLDETTDDGENP